MVIHTVGHTNVDAEEVVTLLEQCGIEMVLDVRSSPYSRFAPQFNRETFAERLWGAGIEYVYAGDRLGGRPRYADARCYEGDRLGRRELEKRESYQEAIDRTVEIATGQTIVVCAVENAKCCHRHWLYAQALSGRASRCSISSEAMRLWRKLREPEHSWLS